MTGFRSLLLAPLLLATACKLDTPMGGQTASLPLVRVDGQTLPATVGTGSSAVLVTGGTLTEHSTTSDCEYELILSGPQTLTGSLSCTEPFATSLPNGILVTIPVTGVSALASPHTYEFAGGITGCFQFKSFCPGVT